MGTTHHDIVVALKPLGFPVAPEAYTGNAKEFFVFSVETTRTVHGSDKTLSAYRTATVHLVAPTRTDALQTVLRAKKALISAGFGGMRTFDGGVTDNGQTKVSTITCGRWEFGETAV